MPISEYVQDLRRAVGTRLLLLPGVAAIVRDSANRVLFIHRVDDGRWGLPAGAIDPGESPAAALIREVREETGLSVRPLRISGVFGGAGFRHRYPNGDEVEYTVIVFDCEIIGGELAPSDGEALDLRYFTPDSVPELALPYPRALFDPHTHDGAPPAPVFE